MLTHNEVVAGLFCLTMVSGFAGGALYGHWYWPWKKKLDEEYDAGWDGAVRDASDRVERHNEVLRLSPDGSARWCDAGSQRDRDGANAPIGFEPESAFKNDVPWPGDSGGRTAEAPGLATMPDVQAGPGHEVRPASPSPVAGRTIYPDLVALDDGPEIDSPGLDAPGPGVDPHWYPNGLHWLADWQAEWHQDVADFEAWLPGYLDHLRDVLEPSWSKAVKMLEAL